MGMTLEKPYPEEVCSNTDVVGVPSWCVQTPDITFYTVGQLLLEIIILFGLFTLSYYYFRKRKHKKEIKQQIEVIKNEPQHIPLAVNLVSNRER